MNERGKESWRESNKTRAGLLLVLKNCSEILTSKYYICSREPLFSAEGGCIKKAIRRPTASCEKLTWIIRVTVNIYSTFLEETQFYPIHF
jgi:hypothetical protein